MKRLGFCLLYTSKYHLAHAMFFYVYTNFWPLRKTIKEKMPTGNGGWVESRKHTSNLETCWDKLGRVKLGWENGGNTEGQVWREMNNTKDL